MRILTSMSRELSFVVDLHPLNRWLLVPLEFPGNIKVKMVLDTGSALSAISEETRDKLVAAGLIGAPSGRFYTLRAPYIHDVEIADLRVHVSRRVSILSLIHISEPTRPY